ncbi:aminotransferase class I/II-fold pyridoxal phosphate-dependent enzyme [Kovacikia minuta CCNUW1]|uniref:aminotransferase class I/II-fold pyridoxal phosphate-dependent enzyme n=1 Tax=Kovacikia minuta TaxID=2931930 RepID=UPI001CCC02FE|nr:aminotransferase class I/II-fold pyridoxal phosphate-dependent enzyme [Kovacikia minuta]UBF28462.1 aminotransferase class I/II-fold pyridoxal phosphate-dependent enzyme [Kovacikia minuta CCNUW1]
MPIDPECPQASTPLLDALQIAARTQNVPFYAPGHKRGQGIPDRLRDFLGSQLFQADLPELPELDNLFAPEGAIQQAQELAAEAFGADRTWFLVNGSTSGVIAAIVATCAPGDKIVMPRNVHQSAISGLILSGAVPVFLKPECDRALDIAHSITPTAVAEALTQHPDAKAVFLVYPTYYGVCGDLESIAAIVHQHTIPLLVDEAHGPHFAFHLDLPMPALAAGADLSVQSTHKVLSAMTQAAMLHTRGSLVDADLLSKALSLVQSTSPSYLLLAALDAARYQMATQGRELMQQTIRRADWARSQIAQIPGLSTLDPEQAGSPGFFSLDRTRLTVTVSNLGIDGFTADAILHQEFGVTCELPSLQHLTFIVSLGNTNGDIERLIQALRTLAERQRTRGGRGDAISNQEPGVRRQASDSIQNSKFKIQNSPSLPTPHSPLPTPHSPRDAFFSPTTSLPVAETVNRISAELVCPYPPGIPVVMPGEVITLEALTYLQQVLAIGGTISGCADPTLKTLKVVQN